MFSGLTFSICLDKKENNNNYICVEKRKKRSKTPSKSAYRVYKK